MPPRYLRKRSPERLKPCQERMVEACDIVPADGCCGVIPCRICVEWDTYEELVVAMAEFEESSWSAVLNDFLFLAFWEVNYETEECEFVILFGGEEVYRATCYEGASCRNPAGEIEITVDYVSGTLRWEVYEPLEVALIDNPETGCRDFFCGSCRCSCETLCVTIDEYSEGISRLRHGEIGNISYPCDPPLWEGSIGYYDLSVALGRDQYGDCIITATVDGVEQPAVSAPGCDNMAASITLDDGTIITFACKICACNDDGTLCCETRCNPYISAMHPGDCTNSPDENPLPRKLFIEMTTDSPYGCVSASAEVTLVENGRWLGESLTAVCTFCCPGNSADSCVWSFSYSPIVNCGSEDGWLIELDAVAYDGSLGPADATINLDFPAVYLKKISCNPIFLMGTKCFVPAMLCAGLMPPLGTGEVVKHPQMCLSFVVYEVLT